MTDDPMVVSVREEAELADGRVPGPCWTVPDGVPEPG